MAADFGPHPPRRPTVVTGASSGIGQAAALAMAAAGHPVVLGGRRTERREETAARIAAEGGAAHPLRLDLADAASVEAFAKGAVEAVGGIDIVVSAAGQSAPDSAADPSPDDFAALVGVNLLGVQRLVAAFLPAMIGRRHGDVVFVTSEMVRHPRVRASGYAASKWGLEGYARTLQMELEGTGVRASIVQPGQTWSEMGGDWDPDVTTEVLEEWIRWGHARHYHLLHPDAVAGAVRTIVEAPPGTHLTLIEVQPEAPIARPAKDEDKDEGDR
ncbi:MAG TPA: SDR family oxidoreductase [Acidimicrobiales bacterium]|nr:SDR family oxidoreductase [Acidimicrobiales bacterium]